MAGTVTDRTQAADAVRTRTNKPLTTLWLVDFPVLSPRSSGGCSGSDEDYIVTVGLTVAELDRDGFVTNNEPFIEIIRRLANRKNPAEVAKIAIDTARREVGSRLVRAVASLNRNGAAKAAWPESLDSAQPSPHDNDRQHSISNMYIEAELVNNAVCGGYNGWFRADLKYTAPHKSMRRNNNYVADNIRQQFSNGILKASCEELAAGLVNATIDIIPEATSVVSRVYNLTGYAETEWSAGMPVCDFPRKATGGEIRKTRSEGLATAVRYC